MKINQMLAKGQLARLHYHQIKETVRANGSLEVNITSHPSGRCNGFTPNGVSVDERANGNRLLHFVTTVGHFRMFSGEMFGQEYVGRGVA